MAKTKNQEGKTMYIILGVVVLIILFFLFRSSEPTTWEEHITYLESRGNKTLTIEMYPSDMCDESGSISWDNDLVKKKCYKQEIIFYDIQRDEKGYMVGHFPEESFWLKYTPSVEDCKTQLFQLCAEYKGGLVGSSIYSSKKPEITMCQISGAGVSWCDKNIMYEYVTPFDTALIFMNLK